MAVVPKFDFPTGSKVTVLNTEIVVTGTDDEGYELYSVENGSTISIPFIDFVRYLKLPGAKIDATLPETGNRLQVRLGGIRTAKLLPASQQELGSFHLSLCHGMSILRQKLRQETGDNDLDLSIRMLNRPEYRRIIQSIAQTLFGKKIILGGGRRPCDVYKQIAETRGCIRPIDPNMRRIHLGWGEQVTPTDEGVRVFHGIWFNSDELQIAIDDARVHGNKVRVFIDPDNMFHATVLVPGMSGPIEVQLQMTAFASLTLVEILDLVAEWRKENPKIAEVHDDRIMRFRRDTYQMMRTIGVERKLPRSYSTVSECQAKAKAVFAGARVIPGRMLQGTTGPDSITRTDITENVYTIGNGDNLIEGELCNSAAVSNSGDEEPQLSRGPAILAPAKPKPQRGRKPKPAAPTLGRPLKTKDLE